MKIKVCIKDEIIFCTHHVISFVLHAIFPIVHFIDCLSNIFNYQKAFMHPHFGITYGWKQMALLLLHMPPVPQGLHCYCSCKCEVYYCRAWKIHLFILTISNDGWVLNNSWLHSLWCNTLVIKTTTSKYLVSKNKQGFQK